MFMEEFNLTRPRFINCFVLENKQKLLFISMEMAKELQFVTSAIRYRANFN